MSLNFDKPSLDVRLEGSSLFSAAANSITEHVLMFGFGCHFNGLDLFAWDSNPGDNVTLEVQYDYGGVWKRYKRFGKNWNVFPNTKDRVLMFPSNPIMGMRLLIKYDNKSPDTAVDFSINAFKFTDVEVINTMVGGEGSDW